MIIHRNFKAVKQPVERSIVFHLLCPPQNTFNNSWFNVPRILVWLTHDSVMQWQYHYDLTCWHTLCSWQQLLLLCESSKMLVQLNIA